MTYKARIVLVRDRAERVWRRERARAVLLRVLLVPEACLHVLRPRNIRGHFRSNKVISEGLRHHRPVFHQQAARSHGVFRLLTGPLVAPEKMGLVEHDGSPGRSAVLTAGIILLRPTRSFF